MDCGNDGLSVFRVHLLRAWDIMIPPFFIMGFLDGTLLFPCYVEKLTEY
jgi:hypothetical protein